jgi:hypothetical protein
MSQKARLHLGPSEIERRVFRRLKPYAKLSFFEQFAMFMGKAQVLEFGLKGLLARRFGCDLEQMERWTLGRTTKELKEQGLRKDFVALLESLVELRNLIAHDLLLSDALVKLHTGKTTRSARRPLEHGIYELEQILLLHDWIEEHGAWVLQDTAQPYSRAPTTRSHDHVVQINEQRRELRIYRLDARGTKTLFTAAPLPAADAESALTEFAKQLGENLLMDSPSARRLLKL